MVLNSFTIWHSGGRNAHKATQKVTSSAGDEVLHGLNCSSLPTDTSCFAESREEPDSGLWLSLLALPASGAGHLLSTCPAEQMDAICREISGCGLWCGLLARPEIIKIITVVCANSVQVLGHTVRQGPPRMLAGATEQQVALGTLFLVITPLQTPPF